MKTSEKLEQAFHEFRPHINGHNTAMELFLEALREVKDLESRLTISDEEIERVFWYKSSKKPPHGMKVIVQHETSNGKDHAFGVYFKDKEAWFYFDPTKWNIEDSIEVTHWAHDLNTV